MNDRARQIAGRFGTTGHIGTADNFDAAADVHARDVDRLTAIGRTAETNRTTLPARLGRHLLQLLAQQVQIDAQPAHVCAEGGELGREVGDEGGVDGGAAHVFIVGAGWARDMSRNPWVRAGSYLKTVRRRGSGATGPSAGTWR
ncbi:hypothetical protein ACFXK0_25935 [Nocardia sp. NPDC059177]|uniref:hypothetical protein n=1 Tax=Nocardia sp. NPDC059177 TaxID=3346759 RepID=UPI00367423B2